jgi:hypothetical protein
VCGPPTVYTAAESSITGNNARGMARGSTCMVMMVVFATDCMPTSIIVYAGSLTLDLPRYLLKGPGQLTRMAHQRMHGDSGSEP